MTAEATRAADRSLRARLAVVALAALALALALPAAADATVTCPTQSFTVVSGQPQQLSNPCTSDVAGATVAFSGIVPGTGPGHGSLNFTTGTYTSEPCYFGPDSFSYTVTDGLTSATGTFQFTVTLNPTCIPPDNRAPTCNSLDLAVVKDTAQPLTTQPCDDPDGDSLRYGVVPDTGPAHGSLRSTTSGGIEYVPEPGYVGPDSFRFSATDPYGAAATGTANILVATAGNATTVVADGTFVANTDALSVPTPIGLSLTSPVAGLVGAYAVEPSSSDPAPTGYELLGNQIEIVAPDASVSDPLVITFAVDPSVSASSVTVMRDGVAIDDPCTDAQAAIPDPCYTVDASANTISVRSSHASTWGLLLPSASFLQPIDGTSINVAKFGRTVPVKVSLMNGATAVSSGSVRLDRLVPNGCSSTAAADGVEVYATTTSATSGSAFRYDSDSGTWVHGLDTRQLTPGVCYRGHVTLGGWEVAHFDLRANR